jgi:hypothetical protein
VNGVQAHLAASERTELAVLTGRPRGIGQLP